MTGGLVSIVTYNRLSQFHVYLLLGQSLFSVLIVSLRIDVKVLVDTFNRDCEIFGNLRITFKLYGRGVDYRPRHRPGSSGHCGQGRGRGAGY